MAHFISDADMYNSGTQITPEFSESTNLALNSLLDLKNGPISVPNEMRLYDVCSKRLDNKNKLENYELTPTDMVDILCQLNQGHAVSARFQEEVSPMIQGEGTSLIKADGTLLIQKKDTSLIQKDGPVLIPEDRSALIQDGNAPIQEEGLVSNNDLCDLILSDSVDIELKPVPSEKKKNPPYLINPIKRITTKNMEPVKFCLKGAKQSQTLSISLKYKEKKYRNEPVVACPLHRNVCDEFNSNFELSHEAKAQVMQRMDVDENPVVDVILEAMSFDRFGVNFIFYITFRCLNSCHKENGKKMEIIFKLYDNEEKRIVNESCYGIRVCRNVKRDYKEAFPVEDSFEEMRPESFLVPLVQEESPPCIKEAKRMKSETGTVDTITAETHIDTSDEGVIKCLEVTDVIERPQYYMTAEAYGTGDAAPCTSQQVKRRRTLSKSDHILDTVARKLDESVHKDDSGIDLFGSYIAHRIHLMDQRTAIITRKIINDVLFEAEMGNLNSSSRFISTP